MQILISFGLPNTFPPEMVPDEVNLFIRACSAGMTKDELLTLADGFNLKPIWKHLPHIGAGVYGFGLDVDGFQVPMMVRMSQ